MTGRQADDQRWDAVVVAGGRASRLGGIDKPAVEVAGRSLLDRVLDAVVAASLTVVVGPARPPAAARSGTPPGSGRPGRLRWTLEDPPGSGPVAAIAAGMALVTSPWVVVLAADLPFLGAGDVARLLAALAGGSDGRHPAEVATLVDPAGRIQPLAAAWRSAALRAALPADAVDAAVRPLLAGRHLVAVPADEMACHDCDSPEALAWARSKAGTMQQ